MVQVRHGDPVPAALQDAPTAPPVARAPVRAAGRVRRLRAAARRHPVAAAAYRVAVAVVGTVVVLVGLVLVPLPGPGWPVVFVGLAVLGTEFSWAGRLSAGARRRVEAVAGRVRAAGWAWRTAVGVGLVVAGVGPLVLLAG